jgi:predicted O-linked N-acetylglucosamine transferase (SPINDLY family)
MVDSPEKTIRRTPLADSIRCVGATSRRDHLTLFEDIDITLDPFPQNGGCQHLGVSPYGSPGYCQTGNSVSSRAAVAVLRAIGFDNLVADDDDD